MMILANALTLFRVAAIGLFWYAMPVHTYAALAIVLAAALSDALDGWIARRYHAVSRTGAFLDRCADKIFYIGALWVLRADISIGLLIMAALPEAILFLMAIASYLGWSRMRLSASVVGKWKMRVHFSAIILLTLGYAIAGQSILSIGFILVWVGYLLSCESIILYLDSLDEKTASATPSR